MRLRQKFFTNLLLIVIFSGCSGLITTPPPPTLSPTPAPITDLDCEVFTSRFNLSCTRIVGGVMLQSDDISQKTLQIANIAITLNGTIYVTHLVNTLTIGTLEGSTAVSTQNATRVLQTGMETTLSLELDTFVAETPPSEPEPYDQQTLRSLPLFRLSRAISPITISTPLADNPLTVQGDEGCQMPEGWTGFYRIQRGDTLTAIANQYEITVRELQEGNCLADVNHLQPDDIIRVPAEFTVTDASFEAETTSVEAGECTSLTWNAEDASLVYFQGEAVANMDSREVCPEITTIYTLLIVVPSGEQIGYTQTITVD